MITVITATLPERARSFAQLAESIARQSLPPSQWLVEWDFEKRGAAAVLNGLAAAVDTEWLFRIDDTDLLELDHFDALRCYLTDDVDVVYSWCRVEGNLAPSYFQRPFSPDRARGLPPAACIRKNLWDQLGGYRDDNSDDFWQRAVDAGARFACVPIVTWRYRVSGKPGPRTWYDSGAPA